MASGGEDFLSAADGSPVTDLLGHAAFCTGVLGGCVWAAVAWQDPAAIGMVAASVWLGVRGVGTSIPPWPSLAASAAVLTATVSLGLDPTTGVGGLAHASPFGPVVYSVLLALLATADALRAAAHLTWPSDRP